MFSKLTSTLLFWQEALARPRQIGAVAPSSPGLSKTMAQWLPTSSDARVVELGPGTGVVTQALLDRGLRESRLIAIEKSERLASHLQKRFPDASIIHGDALDLKRLVCEIGKPKVEVQAVFSSLPLLNFDLAFREAVFEQIHEILSPKGRLVMFTYGIRERCGKAIPKFRFVDSKVVWINLPPARVLVYER